jgi:hypothetical protein
LIPVPTLAEIDDALDQLDWIDLPTILQLRQMVSDLIRKSVTKNDDTTAAGSGLGPMEWTRQQIAILYVLFVSSDEYLERAMRRETSTH